MQVNNLAKIVNFIVANINSNDANNKFNNLEATELFCFTNGEVEVKELEVDIEAVKNRLIKHNYITEVELVEVREFEVCYFDDTYHHEVTFYKLVVKCDTFRYNSNGDTVNEKLERTYYAKFSQNFPNIGYCVTIYSDHVDSCGTIGDSVAYILGWKYNLCGAYYSKM